MEIVLLVSCGKRKSDTICQAQEMYNSERFMLSKKLIKQLGHEWLIVSAKYGLLHPEKTIKPYDLYIGSFNNEKRKEWLQDIMVMLKKYDIETRFVVCADNEYSKLLSNGLDKIKLSCIYPFLGMTYEKQVDYLRNIVNIDKIKRLYNRLVYLSKETGGIHLLKDCSGKMYWPKKGVYFIMDFSECSIVSGSIPKIIRVGTHAVSKNSKSILWGRLKTHKGINNGGGNHRSSVFRLHIGNALIKKNNLECNTWGLDQNATETVRKNERPIEQLVSDYIGKLGVIVLDVDDESSPRSDRAYLEKNSIALLSAINYSFEFTSNNWLGKYSIKKEIIESSLWNINYVEGGYDDNFFCKLDLYIDKTIENYKNAMIKRCNHG